jgi:tetratricopeptide (TPR) repeat protein
MNKRFALRRTALALAPLLVSLLPLAPLAAHAADTTPAASTTPSITAPADKLATARALIADNKWVAAIEELKRVDDRASADWNNLMGYSHRKARTPDHAAAERYYDAALRIDPRHRGALEYSGELYLTLGDLARAEARLGALERVCSRTCAEQAALQQAIAAFKANGNRPVRAP